MNEEQDWNDLAGASSDEGARQPQRRRRRSTGTKDEEDKIGLATADDLQIRANEGLVAADAGLSLTGNPEQGAVVGGPDAAAGEAHNVLPRREAEPVPPSATAEADQGGGGGGAEDERLQRMKARQQQAELRMITPPLPPRRAGSSRAARRRSEGEGAGAQRGAVTSPVGSINASAGDSVVMPAVLPAAVLSTMPASQRGPVAMAGRSSAPRPPPKASRTSFDRFEVRLNQRRWQQWQGNNKFCFGGRVMLGVHYRQLYVTVAMLLGTWGLFFVFILPNWGGVVYSGIGASLLGTTFVALAYASFLDPGIIPRRPPNQVVENMPAEVKDRMNYCVTCHIVRPPRAKHCRHCNNCVASFDHHCPWTGNCVGRRNYRSFFVFILLVVLSAAYIFSLSMVSIVTLLGRTGPVDVTNSDTMVKGGKYFAPLLAMWAVIVLVLVGSLLGFHAYLLVRGQTTNEYLRGEKRRGNTPHKSFCGNCWDLWTQPVPQTLLPDMSDFPSPEDHRKDIDFTLAAVAELQEHMQGGDAV